MSLLPVGFGAGGYEIQKSVRFRASGGPGAMTRTFGSVGNRRIWTHSVWLKRGALNSVQQFLTVGATANDITTFALTADNKLDSLNNIGGLTVARLTSSAVLRDDSGHYHCVVAWDTTHATANNRIRMWINGVEQTSFTTRTNPALNQDTQVNTAAAHWIGRSSVASANHIDGGLSEINHIDGLALTAASFGEFDANGIWVPKKYTGPYGTNGYYLPFNDGTNLTNLCLDRSGNSNHFTASGISLTAGATYDWMDDTPSNSFCTLSKPSSVNAALANGNLTFASATPGTTYGNAWGTLGFSSGKFYWECTVTASNQVVMGVSTKVTGWSGYVGSNANSWGYNSNNGWKSTNTISTAYGSSAVAGDVIGIAMDADAGTLTFYKNGVSMGAAFTGLPSQVYLPAFANYYADVANINFGQRPFAYGPPAGFVALSTKNLAANTVITSGTFTGNANVDGPWVWLNGVPTAMTINGNAVTFGTHADKLANGFKVRSASASYNVSGSNSYSVSTTGPSLKTARAQVNP